MSLFPEKATTATGAKDEFLRLMKDRPGFWAENVADAVEHLKNPEEQIDFLRFMADPKGVTPGRNKDVKVYPVKPTVGMENHPDYELMKVIPGKMPTYQVRYKPRTKEEKVDV